MNELLLGFMPSFNSDLFKQIKFAKINFDFLELTLPYDLKEWSSKYLSAVKESLGGFPLIGHLHWDINLTDSGGIEKATEALRLLRILEARKIVIHPSFPEDINSKEILLKNKKALTTLLNTCKEFRASLLIENGSPTVLDIIAKFKYFIEDIPDLNIALDIGHAAANWKEFTDVFKEKIIHSHLHYSDGKDDHLPFPEDYDFKEITDFLKRQNITATLEIFRKKTVKGIKKIEGIERERILLEQINFIKRKRVG
jgi:hypothetical protein